MSPLVGCKITIPGRDEKPTFVLKYINLSDVSRLQT